MGPIKRFSAAHPAGADPSPTVLAAMAAAEQFAARNGLHPGLAARLAIVVEELVGNVLHHGAGGAAVTFCFELEARDDGVALVLKDTGAPFDPRERPDFAGPHRETGGGVGLELVRAWCEIAGYSRQAGTNRLKLLLRPAGS